MLDRDEFAVAKFLIDQKLQGHDIPEELPQHLIPPSKRTSLLPPEVESSHATEGYTGSLYTDYPMDDEESNTSTGGYHVDQYDYN